MAISALKTETFNTDGHIFNPDNIYDNLKIIEMPRLFVGLATTMELDVEENFEIDVYLKTLYDGQLMKYEDARQVSADHRAFQMEYFGNSKLRITFVPTNECISKAKHDPEFAMRFIVDLRIFRVTGTLCCQNEHHAEIKRIYISGQCITLDITSYPEVVDYGDIMMNNKVTKHVRLYNKSNLKAKCQYIKRNNFNVLPETFTIEANSVTHITVIFSPTIHLTFNVLEFIIISPHHDFSKDSDDSNFLSYKLKINAHVIYPRIQTQLNIESMHKLYEKNPHYTYLENEYEDRTRKTAIGLKFLKDSKARLKKPIKPTDVSYKGPAYVDDPLVITKKTGRLFCKYFPPQPTTFDIPDVFIDPFYVNFGRVETTTYGDFDVTIVNRTKFPLTIRFQEDQIISYTYLRLPAFEMKVSPFSETRLMISCLTVMDGLLCETFSYSINNKYFRLHRYTVQAGNPKLNIPDCNLKFGLISSDTFVTTMALKLCNIFNVPVRYSWHEFSVETPFEVYPRSGTIPEHSCRINELVYICKPIKTKTHELEIISLGNIRNDTVISIEANVLFRKLSVKFLEQLMIFKDMSLNLETSQIVKLENASRDYATFHVLEPLMQGMSVKPMSGVLRPKMVLEVTVSLKIACVIDFNTDMAVKINNKEIIEMTVTGNVEAPIITISPKMVQLSRVPCNMVTYVSLNIVNSSIVKALIEVMDTGDENIFDVVMLQGNEKVKFSKVMLEPGNSKNVFVRVYDVYRREYDMYMPFKVNGLLGPPILNHSSSTEIHFFTQEYEKFYEGNQKIKIKQPENKDICYCRLLGVITVQWVEFSIDNFEIIYQQCQDNSKTFTMKNISRYNFYVTLLLGKLFPNFTLEVVEPEDTLEVWVSDTNIKFYFDRAVEVTLRLNFHPRSRGKSVATALLYLDKAMTMPYSDLTFTGIKQVPTLTAKTDFIIFPPREPGCEVERNVELEIDGVGYDLMDFSCMFKDERYLKVKFVSLSVNSEANPPSTIINAMITACAPTSYCGKCTLMFSYKEESCSNVYVNFTFTLCPLTLHRHNYVSADDDPYPFYPLPEQTEYFDYMNSCVDFLEQWMYQQGFRRELFPIIPDTLLTLSSNLLSQPVRMQKVKFISVSFLNFLKRIAGNLIKSMKKFSMVEQNESQKKIMEIMHTYTEIIKLLKSRGSMFWGLKPKYLLSYEQFIYYNEICVPSTTVDIIMTQRMLADEKYFHRISKQSWLDIILQCYRAFVIDSCVFDCVCVTGENRDIVGFFLKWYNDSLIIHHTRMFHKDQPIKSINNLTTDLSDGLAIISVFLYHCPFLSCHFALMCVDNTDTEEIQINNAALIVEAINLLRIYFPLQSKDFLQPNFLKMLFLSIHLYITLPMFTVRETIVFNPPLLRSSSREIIVSTGSQETLMFNIVLINNNCNNFVVEKTAPPENVKKLYLLATFTANFLKTDQTIMLLHGYNKNRLFDTYIIFVLKGVVGMLCPLKKCKITAPIYRPLKMDIPINTPFTHITPVDYKLHLTDQEPTLPVEFEHHLSYRFYVQRINLIEDHIFLSYSKDVSQKLNMQLICLSAQPGSTWIWFTSEEGQFYIRVTTNARCDMPFEILQTKALALPLVPCSCGEDCECYRTSTIIVPHRNELMVKGLRYALSLMASYSMMVVFDQLIESTYGRMVLHRLFKESGTNISEVEHILKDEISYHITSKNLCPQKQEVTLKHYTDDTFILPVTLPNKNIERFSIMLTSECGLDVRNYRIFVLPEYESG